MRRYPGFAWHKLGKEQALVRCCGTVASPGARDHPQLLRNQSNPNTSRDAFQDTAVRSVVCYLVVEIRLAPQESRRVPPNQTTTRGCKRSLLRAPRGDRHHRSPTQHSNRKVSRGLRGGLDTRPMTLTTYLLEASRVR